MAVWGGWDSNPIGRSGVLWSRTTPRAPFQRPGSPCFQRRDPLECGRPCSAGARGHMRATTDSHERGCALDKLRAPVTVLVGHFGSGKTEIAVNLAVAFRQRGESVTLADLDLVKPYFRSRLARQELASLGIPVMVPEGERVYADLPILVPQVKGLVATAGNGAGRAILDVGGDDLGARVLGAIAGLTDPARTDVLFVVNGRRPFAETLEEVATMLREVEAASRLRVTGLVANTHLMDETTPEIVGEGLDLGRRLAGLTGVPLLFCAALATIAGLPAVRAVVGDLPVLPLVRRITPPFAVKARLPVPSRGAAVV